MDAGASFGLWMKKRRKALDLTQGALAHQVGCSTATVEKIEADLRRPSLQMAGLLATALQIPESERADFMQVARGQRIVDRLAGLPFVAEPSLPSNLPVSPTPLVGRQPELAEIACLLSDADCRLLTLVGPGGIGKTRLALQAAMNQQAQFAHGAYFVPLVGVTDADFIPSTVADALNLTFSGTTSPMSQVLQFLDDKELLLLLDNYEHLLSNIELVLAIFNEACDVKILVTSREPLGVHGEWLFEVQGLPVPQAVNKEIETNSAVLLFMQSIRRAGLNIPDGSEELLAIVDICRLVGGAPLGIELAASWARVLGYQEIASEIRSNMDFLSVTMKGIPERHRSLRAVFDHSWKLMDHEEQQALQRLSVFRGGFTRSAAEFVAGASLGMLASLVTKSLVSRAGNDVYELHEAVRQFAAAHLTASPDYGEIRDRHCDYYLTLFAEKEQALKSANQREVIRQLSGEFDNIRDAWLWATEQQHFELIHRTLRCLGWFCDIIGWMQVGIDQLEPVVRILQKNAAGNRSFQATLGVALAQQGLLYFRQGHFNQALAHYEESLAWLRPLGDPGILTDSLVWSGIILYLLGDIERSRRHLSEGQDCAEFADDQWSVAYALFNLGLVASLVGDYEAGYKDMLDALTMWREQGDPSSISLGLNFISPTAVLLGYLDEAETFSKESLSWTSRIGDRWGEGTAYRNLGLVALARGNLDKARSRIERSLNIFSQVVTGWDIVLTLDYLGRITLAEGDDTGAEEIFKQALKFALEVRTTPLAMNILVGLARIYLKRKDYEAAFLLASFAMENPTSTQETRDAAAEVASPSTAHLSNKEIRAEQQHAAQQTLEALAEQIFIGQLDANMNAGNNAT